MLRLLTPQDYHKGYLDLLSHLSPMLEMSAEDFTNIEYKRMSMNIHTWVIEQDDKIVSSACMLIEPKFSRGGKNVAHIEDVVTLPNYRGRGYSGLIINKLIKLAKEQNCYKIILDCKEELIGFYNKFGFEKKEHQLVLYYGS